MRIIFLNFWEEMRHYISGSSERGAEGAGAPPEKICLLIGAERGSILRYTYYFVFLEFLWAPYNALLTPRLCFSENCQRNPYRSNCILFNKLRCFWWNIELILIQEQQWKFSIRIYKLLPLFNFCKHLIKIHD